jgi:hypothetical protein
LAVIHGGTERATVKHVVLGKLEFSDDIKVSPEFRLLVGGLLTIAPRERLRHNSIAETVRHARLANVQETPPPMSRLHSTHDSRYFEQ